MIVFCGYANRDVTVSVPELPGPGTRVQATAIRTRDGGMGANAAVASARLGAHAWFAGSLGRDRDSTAFLRQLARDGVNTSLTTRDRTLTTSVVLLTPDGERAIISQDDQLDVAEVTRVVAAAASVRADWIYLDGYRFPDAAGALAGHPGPRVLVDLDGCPGPAAARAALHRADHVVVGRASVAGLIGHDPAAAATAHRVHLVITDGGRGWTLHAPDGRAHHGAALAVRALDTTGAGDCFVGAYAAELDRGSTPADAARFASAAAGLSCTVAGARDGLPSRRAVLAQLTRTPPSPSRRTSCSER